MNLKFCVDIKYQDCLIWEYNREIYIFSCDTETNNAQNFKQFMENFSFLICSNSFDMRIENVDLKKYEEFIMILGEVDNLDELIENHYKHLYNFEFSKEVREDRIEESKIEETNKNQNLDTNTDIQKTVSYVNFISTYPNAKIVFQGKVFYFKFNLGMLIKVYDR